MFPFLEFPRFPLILMLKEGLNQRLFQRARIQGPSNDMKPPDTFPSHKSLKKKKSPLQEKYASREIKIKAQFRRYLLRVHLFRLTHTNEQVDRVQPSASEAADGILRRSTPAGFVMHSGRRASPFRSDELMAKPLLPGELSTSTASSCLGGRRQQGQLDQISPSKERKGKKAHDSRETLGLFFFLQRNHRASEAAEEMGLPPGARQGHLPWQDCRSRQYPRRGHISPESTRAWLPTHLGLQGFLLWAKTGAGTWGSTLLRL